MATLTVATIGVYGASLQEILDRVDMDAFAASLPREHPSALLCVERDARACHRSLIAERLADEQGATVIDLVA